MTIQEIIAALGGHGVTVTASQLETFLAEQGMSAADVTPDTIALIAEELKPKAIAVSKGGKATKAPKRESRKTRTAPANALSVAAKNTQIEINAITDVIRAGANQMAEQTANEMLDVIREVPNLTLQKFGELVGADEADPAHFQNAANELAASVFGFVPSDAA